MENLVSHNSQGENLNVTTENQIHFSEAAKWAKFLGIVQLISVIIFILFGLIFAFAAGSFMPESVSQIGGISATAIGVLYVLIGAVMIYPILALIRFGKNTRQGIKGNDQSLFNTGIENLKKFFKFIGILTAIFIGLYALFFVIALIAATFS